MRSLAVLPIAGMLLGASGPPRTASWVTIADSPVAVDATLKRNDSVIFAHIAPKVGFRLDEDAIGADGKTLSTVGTSLILTHGDSDAACQATGGYGLRYACFTDADADGRFDEYFLVSPMSQFFFQSLGRDGASQALRAPVRYHEVAVKDGPTLEVRLRYIGGGGLVMPDRFSLCVTGSSHGNIWGPDKSLKFCTYPEITVRGSALPVSIDVRGGSVSFLRKHDGAYDVRVVAPPARSSF